MLTAQTAFKYAALIYLLATTFSYLTSSKKILAGIIFSGLSLNCVALFLRYNQAWPMLPMYLSPIVSSFCLATLLLILILFNRDKSSFRTIKYGLLFLTVATILTTTFPKDFYLPFLKSKSLLAHGFMLLGAAGKSCFIICAAYALTSLLKGNQIIAEQPKANDTSNYFFWGAIGYALWTVSMFCGELWCYLGWGTPLVWDDAALLTTMAVWFYYTCFLHLQLTHSWSVRARAWYATAGAPLIFIFNYIPDLGPFRTPF